MSLDKENNPDIDPNLIDLLNYLSDRIEPNCKKINAGYMLFVHSAEGNHIISDGTMNKKVLRDLCESILNDIAIDLDPKKKH